MPRAEIETPSPVATILYRPAETRKLMSRPLSHTTLPRGTPLTYGLHWSAGVRSVIRSEPLSTRPTTTPFPGDLHDAAPVLDRERAAGGSDRAHGDADGERQGEQGQCGEAHTFESIGLRNEARVSRR